MEPQDIDEVAHLFDLYRQFYKQTSDLTSSKAFISERYAKSESRIIVAISESGIVGFTQLYPLFSSVRMKPVFLLNDLYTVSSHRNMGIGGTLIDFCQQLCRNEGIAGLSLETERSNDQGNHLYPKLGFVLDTEHNFYSWNA